MIKCPIKQDSKNLENLFVYYDLYRNYGILKLKIRGRVYYGKKPNQKLKLLYLMGILQEFTDEDHAMSLSEILAELQRNGISAERKSLYDDMESLRTYGIDIVKTGGRNCGYYIANRTFELPELKLLVDAVQSSKFITVKNLTELIKSGEPRQQTRSQPSAAPSLRNKPYQDDE